MDPITLAILAGVSLLGGFGGMVYTNRKQRQIQQEQQRYDQRMWDKMNAYNHPGAQMQRLMDAGLNPNLVYGSGNVTGNTNTQALKAREWNYQNPVQDPMSKLMMYTGLRKNVEVTDATRIKKNLDLAKTITEGSKNLNLIAQNRNIKLAGDQKKQLIDYNIQNFKNQLLLQQQLLRLRTTEADLKGSSYEAERKLHQRGMFKSDPLIQRLAGSSAGSIFDYFSPTPKLQPPVNIGGAGSFFNRKN